MRTAFTPHSQVWALPTLLWGVRCVHMLEMLLWRLSLLVLLARFRLLRNGKRPRGVPPPQKDRSLIHVSAVTPPCTHIQKGHTLTSTQTMAQTKLRSLNQKLRMRPSWYSWRRPPL